MDDSERQRLIQCPDALAAHISDVLVEGSRRVREQGGEDGEAWVSSAVLFLLRDPPRCAREEGPSLVLNKRSERVPQPGDLCCPGGGRDPWDPWLAKLAALPGMPLHRWPPWRSLDRAQRREISILTATAMREGFEEMRLLPKGVTFLGLLPPQRLYMLHRAIHPVVARLSRPQVFKPNWEVEAIVSIPLRHLLDPARYARYRVRFEGNPEANERLKQDFMCFRHGERVLWGATYRITTRFLEAVFDFSPPTENLPIVKGSLSETYLTGQRR
jgi:hypothetical protein